MVEEYARHNGHADPIRESVDGLPGSSRAVLLPKPVRSSQSTPAETVKAAPAQQTETR
jgi:Protein of unknown function (DUF664)